MSNLEPTRFNKAVEVGKVADKSGWHNPDKSNPFSRSRRSCSCEKTTNKGAYRDMEIKLPYKTVCYYHQHPVVVKNSNRIRISSCGWKTRTTKERINRHLPRGYYVYQEDFEWFLKKPDGEEVPFEDGMVLEV